MRRPENSARTSRRPAWISSVPLGTHIRLGPSAVVELTGLRTPCVLIERFRARLKRQVLSSEKTGPPFKCGVLGVVRVGGRVAAGAGAHILLPSEPHDLLAPLWIPILQDLPS